MLEGDCLLVYVALHKDKNTGLRQARFQGRNREEGKVNATVHTSQNVILNIRMFSRYLYQFTYLAQRRIDLNQNWSVYLGMV